MKRCAADVFGCSNPVGHREQVTGAEFRSSFVWLQEARSRKCQREPIHVSTSLRTYSCASPPGSARYPPGTEPPDSCASTPTLPHSQAERHLLRVPTRGWWTAGEPHGPVLRAVAQVPRSVVHCGAGPQPDPAKLTTARALQPYTALPGAMGGRSTCGRGWCPVPVLQPPAFAAPSRSGAPRRLPRAPDDRFLSAVCPQQDLS